MPAESPFAFLGYPIFVITASLLVGMVLLLYYYAKRRQERLEAALRQQRRQQAVEAGELVSGWQEYGAWHQPAVRAGFTAEEIASLGCCFAAKAAAESDVENGEEEKECAVCLCGFQEKEVLRRLSACGHTFHQDCIDQWLKGKSSCPVCRRDLRVGLEPSSAEDKVTPGAHMELPEEHGPQGVQEDRTPTARQSMDLGSLGDRVPGMPQTGPEALSSPMPETQCAEHGLDGTLPEDEHQQSGRTFTHMRTQGLVEQVHNPLSHCQSQLVH